MKSMMKLRQFAALQLAYLAQLLLDHGVVGDGDALLVNVSEATLVHQLADGLDRLLGPSAGGGALDLALGVS